jgi:hypothetical protein
VHQLYTPLLQTVHQLYRQYTSCKNITPCGRTVLQTANLLMFTMVLNYIEYWFRFRLQFWIQTYLAHVFNNKKCVQNLAKKQHCFPERWPLSFDFFTFVLHFMLDPEPEPIFITVPIPLREQVAVTACSGSKTLESGSNESKLQDCIFSPVKPPPHPPPPRGRLSHKI